MIPTSQKLPQIRRVRRTTWNSAEPALEIDNVVKKVIINERDEADVPVGSDRISMAKACPSVQARLQFLPRTCAL